MFILLWFIIEFVSFKIKEKEGFAVKNTTLRFFSELICPHYCSVCGKYGQILCECCKKDLLDAAEMTCLRCGLPIIERCPSCSLPFDKQWLLGYWGDAWKGLVSEYKYSAVRAYAAEFAELLAERLPVTTDPIVIVPLPTIRKHIRERGMDHVYLIAKKLAKIRCWKVEKILVRKNNTVQVGRGRSERQKQAKNAYKIGGVVDDSVRYLLLDDVWTTGSSICAAAELLRLL